MFRIHAAPRRLSLASSIVLALLTTTGVAPAWAADASTVRPSPLQPSATVQPIKAPVPVATPTPTPPKPAKARKANGVRGGDDDLDDLEVERLRNKPGAK